MSSHPRPRAFVAVLAFVLLSSTACMGLPPVFTGPHAGPAATVPPPAAEVQATSAVPPTSAPVTDRMLTPTPAPALARTAITGNVTYLQRIALRPDAVVEVELQDVSRADAPATVVGKQRIETNGRQVPIPFAVEYELSSINPANLYSLRARIIEDGLVTWLTADAPRVLTRGAPTDQVEVVVQQSNNPQPVQPPAGRLEGTVAYLSRIALPPNAVIEVKLEDISRADAPSVVVASQTIPAQGKQVPIPYVLEYDPAKIDPAMRYAVSARITEDGKLTWISTTIRPVLTRGAPKNDVEIILDRVKSN